MANLTELRIAARELFDETLRAVDPYEAVRSIMTVDESHLIIAGEPLKIASRSVYCIALGKAAARMGQAADAVLGDRLSSGVISSNFARPGSGLSARWQQFNGGHPEPNNESLAAARASFDLLERARSESAVVLFLVSGGGSAMLEWPANDDISLADLRAANKALVNSGASINEINSVRRAFSAVKGGKLAAWAPTADQITLIVSDVPAGQESSVASGPTLTTPPNVPAASEIISTYHLRSQLPPAVVRAITATELSPHPRQLRGKYFVLLDNQKALDAAAEAAGRKGFIVQIAAGITDQPITEGCRLLREQFEALRSQHRNTGKSLALISGGEFSCPVPGAGMGGRNLETALRLAMSNPAISNSPHSVALCAGTDGIDGNSPAAGAICDTTTVKRAEAIGVHPEDFLRRSDSYSFFISLGDVITTGATGTNVRDIRLLLASNL